MIHLGLSGLDNFYLFTQESFDKLGIGTTKFIQRPESGASGQTDDILYVTEGDGFLIKFAVGDEDYATGNYNQIVAKNTAQGNQLVAADQYGDRSVEYNLNIAGSDRVLVMQMNALLFYFEYKSENQEIVEKILEDFLSSVNHPELDLQIDWLIPPKIID